jgi:hypothetical protein
MAQCQALSKSANWNQNEADWGLMLATGYGWGISLADGTLVASTLVLPYGEFAWISMVLVLPAHQRKGHASRLLRTAIADLRGKGLTPILDATPAGREVYRQEGFHDTWSFKRFLLRQPARMDVARSAAPVASDWPAVLALDAEAFGGKREALLRALQKRLPQCALSNANGFVLGREGREAQQIGPLIARDEATALSLLQQALRGTSVPLYVDVVDHAPRIQQWLQDRGFVFQRPYTRMVHGSGSAPGDERLVYLVAGPEFG